MSPQGTYNEIRHSPSPCTALLKEATSTVEEIATTICFVWHPSRKTMRPLRWTFVLSSPTCSLAIRHLVGIGRQKSALAAFKVELASRPIGTAFHETCNCPVLFFYSWGMERDPLLRVDTIGRKNRCRIAIGLRPLNANNSLDGVINASRLALGPLRPLNDLCLLKRVRISKMSYNAYELISANVWGCF